MPSLALDHQKLQHLAAAKQLSSADQQPTRSCMMCCRHVCPYHASRDVLNEGAALVFVTYSQLLDPPVRSANGLDDLLQGAVLVFDEVLHPLFGTGKH
jgi:Rad3-related DNA helicase